MDEDTNLEWRNATINRCSEIRTALTYRLQSIRENSGVSKRQLALKTGLSRAAIRNYETGKQSPTLDTLILLADGLGADLPAILKEEIKLRPKIPQT